MISIKESALPLRRLTDYDFQMRMLEWDHWEDRRPFRTIGKSPSQRRKQKSIHHTIIQSAQRAISVEWKRQSLSESVGQSVIWSGLNWLHDGQGQEESRFDLFVIGLQGVINRPELKQHLREHIICKVHQLRCRTFWSLKMLRSFLAHSLWN